MDEILRKDERNRCYKLYPEDLENLDPEDRLVAVARALEEEGFMPGVDPMMAMKRLACSVAQSQAERDRRAGRPAMLVSGLMGSQHKPMIPYEPAPPKPHPRHRWYNRLGRWIGLWVARQAVPA